MKTLNADARASLPLDQYINSNPAGFKLHHWPDWIQENYRPLSVSRLRGNFVKMTESVFERTRREVEYEVYKSRRERARELANSLYVAKALNVTPAVNTCSVKEMALVRCTAFVLCTLKETGSKELKAISAQPVGDEVACFHCKHSNRTLAWGKYARVWGCKNAKCAFLGVTAAPGVLEAVIEEFKAHCRAVGLPGW